MEEKRFSETIKDQISGQPKRKILVTFPIDVFDSFDLYAKENTADCYWLAIKQLLDFYKSQTEADIKSVLLLDYIKQLESKVDDLNQRLEKLEKPTVKNFQTFGNSEEKK